MPKKTRQPSKPGQIGSCYFFHYYRKIDPIRYGRNQQMKTQIRAALSLVASFLLVIPAGTAAAEEIELETAVALALSSNLGIESELLTVRQKKLIADTWWNRFYPTVNATTTLARSNTERSIAGADLPRWGLSAGLDFSLILTLQTIPGFSLARLDYESGLIDLADARAQIERDVSKQFYDLLLLKEQIALVEEQIATAERRYDQAQINFDNGLIDEFTLLSSQVQVENLRPALTGFQVAYQQTLLAFQNSVGLPLTATVDPVGTIAPPTLIIRYDDIDESQLRGRFDIQQLE
ncbi:MAG: TolC family protein, partial [Opitutales bacterium]|nr:TolC family protein [Opitutales bacterium]